MICQAVNEILVVESGGEALAAKVIAKLKSEGVEYVVMAPEEAKKAKIEDVVMINEPLKITPLPEFKMFGTFTPPQTRAQRRKQERLKNKKR